MSRMSRMHMQDFTSGRCFSGGAWQLVELTSAAALCLECCLYPIVRLCTTQCSTCARVAVLLSWQLVQLLPGLSHAPICKQAFGASAAADLLLQVGEMQLAGGQKTAGPHPQ